MLKMKEKCERCGAETGLMATAYICSFECTFCEACAKGMNDSCPNCAGNLVVRPTRARKPLEVGFERMRRKVLGA